MGGTKMCCGASGNSNPTHYSDCYLDSTEEWEKEFDTLIGPSFNDRGVNRESLKGWVRGLIEKSRHEEHERCIKFSHELEMMSIARVVQLAESEIKSCEELNIPQIYKNSGGGYEIAYKDGHNNAMRFLISTLNSK